MPPPLRTMCVTTTVRCTLRTRTRRGWAAGAEATALVPAPMAGSRPVAVCHARVASTATKPTIEPTQGMAATRERLAARGRGEVRGRGSVIAALAAVLAVVVGLASLAAVVVAAADRGGAGDDRAARGPRVRFATGPRARRRRGPPPGREARTRTAPRARRSRPEPRWAPGPARCGARPADDLGAHLDGGVVTGTGAAVFEAVSWPPALRAMAVSPPSAARVAPAAMVLRLSLMDGSVGSGRQVAGNRG